jgi:hypothetical protein
MYDHDRFYKQVLLQSDDNYSVNSINTMERFRPNPPQIQAHHIEAPLLLPDPPEWLMRRKAAHLAHLLDMQQQHHHHCKHGVMETDVMIGAILVTGFLLFGIMHISNGGKNL